MRHAYPDGAGRRSVSYVFGERRHRADRRGPGRRPRHAERRARAPPTPGRAAWACRSSARSSTSSTSARRGRPRNGRAHDEAARSAERVSPPAAVRRRAPRAPPAASPRPAAPGRARDLEDAPGRPGRKDHLNLCALLVELADSAHDHAERRRVHERDGVRSATHAPLPRISWNAEARSGAANASSSPVRANDDRV